MVMSEKWLEPQKFSFNDLKTKLIKKPISTALSDGFPMRLSWHSGRLSWPVRDKEL